MIGMVFEDGESEKDSVCEESVVPCEEKEAFEEEENSESEVEPPKQLTEKEMEGDRPTDRPIEQRIK